MDAGIITLISVAVNALVAVFAPFVARRMSKQEENLTRAEHAMETLGAGIRVIERAVEENKDALSRTGAGNRIAQTIQAYGPAARQLVDTARVTAQALHQAAVVSNAPTDVETSIPDGDDEGHE
jgi:hypothetical protein